MTRREYAGGAAPLVLSGSIGTSDTSISTTGTATGWPTGGVGKFLVVIDRGLATEEKLLAESRSGNTLTLSSASDRGQDDTAAASHLSGATVEHVLGAIDLDEPNEHINDTTEDHHTQYMKADGTRHDLASRHLIGTTWAAPAAPAALSATASAGVATDPARSDHVHPVGVWQDYTPAFVGESPTFGSGAVVEGRYMQVGDLVTGWGYFKLGTGFDSGVETAWRIELPVTARSEDASVSDSNLPIGTCEMKHLATGARFLGIASIAYGDPDSAVFRAENAGASYVASDAPFDWAATDWFIFHFSYEAA